MIPFARAAAPLAACLLSVVAGSAHAQPGITPLRVGQSLNGQLVSADEPVNDRGRFHAYRFDAREGQRVVLTAESNDFDTYLVVGRQVGPVLDELKRDDDGGEGTHSRLRFTAPRTGPYLVLVQSYAEDGLGAYTVSLADAPAPLTGGSRAISLGATEEGVLADTDNEDDETDKFYDQYTFRGRAGQRIEIEMSSDAFDTYLRLGRLDGCDWEELAVDDDGGEGTGSRLRHT
ncbi:MAG TPA: PPC domain-containing protein, partial [Longimicrobium sp.]|nr:PPC domain-containing protein [Longimicrobium sp.]